MSVNFNVTAIFKWQTSNDAFENGGYFGAIQK